MDQQQFCLACGTQFPPEAALPAHCPICADDRQFIPETGQAWTTAAAIATGYKEDLTELHNNLIGIGIKPAFAIGQRALLVVSPGGNILWDCVPLLNQAIIDFIRAKGGLKAIAISHPHYYSNMNDWAEVFNCPIYIHEKDKAWIVHSGERISLWSGREKLFWDGICMINTGGHFDGSCVLYLPALQHGGTILCGDTLQIAKSRRHIGILYSYPNYLPLPLSEIRRIQQEILQLRFDGMYGAFPFQNMPENARQIFSDSMERYV